MSETVVALPANCAIVADVRELRGLSRGVGGRGRVETRRLDE